MTRTAQAKSACDARFRAGRALCAALALGLALLALWPPPAARAQGFAQRPIRLVVPFPPGGPTDIVARPLAQLLGDALRQQVVVENKGGAGGAIGAEQVAKAAPDGYTLLMATVGTHAINASLYKKLSYDPVADFTPIALVAIAPVAIVVNAADPIRSLADLVRTAAQKPDAIAYGSAGNGTPGHLTGALFEASARVRLRHVPYKGSAPAVIDLLGGQIPLMFDPVQSVFPHVESGKLRALAVTGRARSSALPDVPTVAESGYASFESSAWWAVFAPAGLPEPLRRQLTAAIEKLCAAPAFAERLGNRGVVANTDFSESLSAFQAREIAKWSRAVRDSGATVD